jgi:hypothetical protein
MEGSARVLGLSGEIKPPVVEEIVEQLDVCGTNCFHPIPASSSIAKTASPYSPPSKFVNI